MAVSAWDVEIGSRTCWAEARSDGNDGMTAVAWAEVNRHNAGKWYSGATLADTCLMRWMFSSWNDGDPNGPQALRLAENDPLLAFARTATQIAIAGGMPDPTNGATHYYAPDVVPEPTWVKGIDKTGKQVAPPATYCCKIGSQLFYKDVA